VEPQTWRGGLLVEFTVKVAVVEEVVMRKET